VKWLGSIVILFAAIWLSYNLGYESGLNSAPQVTLQMQKDAIARAQQHDEFMRSLGHSEPDLTECLALTRGFDGDIEEMCIAFFEDEENARHEASEEMERDRY
jgi:hypothetical protein